MCSRMAGVPVVGLYLIALLCHYGVCSLPYHGPERALRFPLNGRRRNRSSLPQPVVLRRLGGDSGTTTASVPLQNDEGVQYYMSIVIGAGDEGQGGQDFSVAPDTGSYDLWVPSVQCDQCSLGNAKKRYNWTLSPYAHRVGSQYLEVTYADGARVIGEMILDRVSMKTAGGNITVPSQGLLSVVNYTSPDSVMLGEGLMGLAPRPIEKKAPKTSPESGEKVKEKDQMSFVHSVFAAHPALPAYVSFSLKWSGDGSCLVFGDPDINSYAAPAAIQEGNLDSSATKHASKKDVNLQGVIWGDNYYVKTRHGWYTSVRSIGLSRTGVEVRLYDETPSGPLEESSDPARPSQPDPLQSTAHEKSAGSDTHADTSPEVLPSSTSVGPPSEEKSGTLTSPPYRKPSVIKADKRRLSSPQKDPPHEKNDTDSVDHGGAALIDSGSSLIILRDDIYETLTSELVARKLCWLTQDALQGDWKPLNCRCPSSLGFFERYPHLRIELIDHQNNPIEICLSGEEYVLSYWSFFGSCSGALSLQKGVPQQPSPVVLGMAFMRSFYTIFDVEDGRIGLIRAADSPPLPEGCRVEQQIFLVKDIGMWLMVLFVGFGVVTGAVIVMRAAPSRRRPSIRNPTEPLLPGRCGAQQDSPDLPVTTPSSPWLSRGDPVILNGLGRNDQLASISTATTD